MKKYILLLLAFLLVPALRAQGRFKIPKLSGVSEAVSRQVVRSELGSIGRGAAVSTATPAAPGVSVAGYFHLVGSGKIADPVIHFPAPADKTTPRYTSQKRSRESLQLELNAFGFPQHLLEKYSRDELENTLLSYRAFASVKDILGRNIEDQLRSGEFTAEDPLARYEKDWTAESVREQFSVLKQWAESQPDYFEDNYLGDMGLFLDTHYTEPFNPAVKSLRILLVRDIGQDSVLFEIAKEYPAVTIERAFNAGRAKKMLAENHYDVVLTDFVLGDGTGYEVSMYVWNKKLGIPVVSYSSTLTSSYVLLKYNMVGELPVVGTPAGAKATLNYLSNVVTTGRAYPPRPVVSAPAKQERYISPFASFLSDEPENISWSSSQRAEEWVAHAALKKMSPKRSLESVEAECLANGMLQEVIDKIPPTERLVKLGQWLSVYNSMREGWRGPSRYEDVIREGKLSASDVQGISWITQQAEFQAVASNYLTATYPEPFHPQVSSLRILVVNDLTSVAEPLQEAAKDISKNGRTVTVDIAPTIDAAQNTLEKAFIARRPYDLVLLDYHGLEGRAADLSMWIYNNSNLSVPVVFYASTGAIPEILFKFNIVGRIAIAPTADEARQVLNYASNIVATGKAYPNNK